MLFCVGSVACGLGWFFSLSILGLSIVAVSLILYLFVMCGGCLQPKNLCLDNSRKELPVGCVSIKTINFLHHTVAGRV